MGEHTSHYLFPYGELEDFTFKYIDALGKSEEQLPEDIVGHLSAVCGPSVS